MQLRIAFSEKQDPSELGSRWEHSLKRDDECEAQEGHHVVVRQITAGYGRSEWTHLHIARRGAGEVKIASPKLCP